MRIGVSLLYISIQETDSKVVKPAADAVYINEWRFMNMGAVGKQDKYAFFKRVYPNACVRKPQMPKALRRHFTSGC